MSKVKFCLWGSEPDMLQYDFPVKVLAVTPEELAQRAIEWGYDGIEFMPNPEHVPDPGVFGTALRRAGISLLVVNSGRIAAQGMGLFHEDPIIRKKSIEGFKNMLDFAGYFKTRLGLGGARGRGIPGLSKEETEHLAEEVFRELTEHAEKVGAVIMLEACGPPFVIANSNKEVMEWVGWIASPNFTMHLDTYELLAVETSIDEGIRVTKGIPQHIHLFDTNHGPPGILPEKEGLDWQHIAELLRENGFNGSGSVTIVPEGDPEPAARKSLAYVRDIFNKQGI